MYWLYGNRVKILLSFICILWLIRRILSSKILIYYIIKTKPMFLSALNLTRVHVVAVCVYIVRYMYMHRPLSYSSCCVPPCVVLLPLIYICHETDDNCVAQLIHNEATIYFVYIVGYCPLCISGKAMPIVL